jgi:23S rRNA (adenine1618-N6)-methyltransferase
VLKQAQPDKPLIKKGRESVPFCLSSSMTHQRKKPTEQSGLHPRNPHHGRYDFPALCESRPALSSHLKPNPKGDDTIDFSDPAAVICLNKALLAHYYQVTNWDIPAGYLCPPIPGRADYIHCAADLIGSTADKKVRLLDIGTGANCIYPIIGSQSYGWEFVATDIDPVSVKNAQTIIRSNPCLTGRIRVVLQPDKQHFFTDIITAEDRFDLTLCNPPFHASLEEATAGNLRKQRNLGKADNKTPNLNFGGQKAELWCVGGEIAFLKKMAKESVEFAQQVRWFTSLVSKEENVRPLKKRLKQLGAQTINVVKMQQGQKVSRLIAWSFLSPEQQTTW